LARIVETVREAQGSKPPIQKLVDKVAGVFVPIVIGIAALSFGVWFLVGPEPRLNYAAVVAVAVLVIACPCALGLATPIAIMVAVGKAAELGVLVKDGVALEAAGRVDLVVLDKTGTVTEGRPTVTDLLPLGERAADDVLRWAAAAESRSEHPLGQAVVAAARARGLSVEEPEAFQAHAGAGVTAGVGGHAVVLGTEGFLRDWAIEPGTAAPL